MTQPPRSSWPLQDHRFASLLSQGLALVLVCLPMTAATYGCSADQGATEIQTGDSRDSGTEVADINDAGDAEAGVDDDGNTLPECTDYLPTRDLLKFQLDDFVSAVLDNAPFDVVSVASDSFVLEAGARRLTVTFAPLYDGQLAMMSGMAVKLSGQVSLEGTGFLSVWSVDDQLLWKGFADLMGSADLVDVSWTSTPFSVCAECRTCDANEWVCTEYERHQIEVLLTDPPTVVPPQDWARFVTRDGHPYVAVNQLVFRWRGGCGSDGAGARAYVYLARLAN